MKSKKLETKFKSKIYKKKKLINTNNKKEGTYGTTHRRCSSLVALFLF